ncbi:hypothetical protein [Streptomyces canus]|uniref:hypothetical protein n=1 Tax=Streptomyces canus TaxID=58343 RepID=UPI0027D7989E|nr:hypothetical protein [Streptomyces canus]
MLPAARGAFAAAGGNAHLLAIGPAEGAPAVHGTEMYALIGQEQPGRSPEQASRDTRIRAIVLDFVTGEQTRLWPAVTDRPTSGRVSATLPTSPAPATRRSWTCSGTSPAPDGRRPIRGMRAHPAPPRSLPGG